MGYCQGVTCYPEGNMFFCFDGKFFKNLCMTLGKPVAAKINEFLKKFQPGFDTPPVLELFIAKNIPKIS